ncbi:MAG: molybdate ABC transporter substrate-binding protein [Proteobacteria bacterium]|nr:molybdate ABC transporter substrate-binding protein [Pseudomonadota bacterium]
MLGAQLRAEEITVSAAASLGNAFREMASAFQAEHAEVEVLLNFAPSDALLQQLGAGAPIDVLATADGETMDKAVARKLVAPASRRDFAGNSLVVVTPADGRLAITALTDLKQAGVKRIALGNPAGVPAGRYAQGALQQAGLWPLPTGKAVYAQSVRQALDYVARGEVEAGFVYATDARMHADKVKVALDAPTDQAIIYPLAVTRDSRNKDSAAAFIAFVMSPAGQAVLARFGFKAP